MKIGIVNDMFMAAEALRRAVVTDTDHEVVWIAENGRMAVEHCARLRPDLILMDLVMPEMDGVEATRRIMETTPCAILIVTASVDGNAGQVFAAMGCGALDAVNTPLLGVLGDGPGRAELLKKIKTIEMLIQPAKAPVGASAARRSPQGDTAGIQLVAIGASSGGPLALAQVLAALPENFPAPIVVIQHVDAQFARQFAAWLNEQTRLQVRTVTDLTKLEPGVVYLSERDDHLVLNAWNTLGYATEPRDIPYRPSVDVFMSSVHQNARGRVIAILLTGMGRDGADGLLRLKQRGDVTIVQDRATSAVYGMPRAAFEMGAATHVLPLSNIASVLMAVANNPETVDTTL